MPRLTLSRKIFLALAALLIVLLLSFAGLSIVALQRGLGSYVAEIEIRRMDWLSQLLLKHYAANGDWKKLRDNDDAWHRLQMGRLAAVLDGASSPDERKLPPGTKTAGRAATAPRAAQRTAPARPLLRHRPNSTCCPSGSCRCRRHGLFPIRAKPPIRSTSAWPWSTRRVRTWSGRRSTRRMPRACRCGTAGRSSAI
ncbi:hypothetical protein [Variovorax sp. AFSI2.2]|uniref:hypothetical protein n=1 Tax=Variovorax sp. AFSI2.2 TaxID=3384160 RepID=UPI003EB8CC17